MWDEWLEEYEQVQWKQNGDYYNGYIKSLEDKHPVTGDSGLTVKVTSINHVNDWNSSEKGDSNKHDVYNAGQFVVRIVNKAIIFPRKFQQTVTWGGNAGCIEQVVFAGEYNFVVKVHVVHFKLSLDSN